MNEGREDEIRHLVKIRLAGWFAALLVIFFFWFGVGSFIYWVT